MDEMNAGKLKSGRSGKKVTNPKQAIAIALSEARKKGAKVPPNPNGSSSLSGIVTARCSAAPQLRHLIATWRATPLRCHRHIRPVHTDVEAGLLKLLFHIDFSQPASAAAGTLRIHAICAMLIFTLAEVHRLPGQMRRRRHRHQMPAAFPLIRCKRTWYATVRTAEFTCNG